MSKLTNEQEEEILNLISPSNWYELGGGYYSFDEVEEFIKELGYKNDFKCISSWGGEGKGEDIGSVHFSDSMDLYIRIDGYYASFYGSEFNKSPYIVRPFEKVVTFYE